jgi:hypothetical protein
MLLAFLSVPALLQLDTSAECFNVLHNRSPFTSGGRVGVAFLNSAETCSAVQAGN